MFDRTVITPRLQTRFSSASQRAKPHLRTVVLAVITLTVLFTLSSVRHLAEAIAARHSLAGGSGDENGQKPLAYTQDVADKGSPYWLQDGAIHRSTTSVRGNAPNETVKATLSQHLQQRSEASQAKSGNCNIMNNTDYWGEPVKWGSNNKLASAEACCADCHSYQPSTSEDLSCNVWVYCGDKDKCGNQYMDCWLKHLAHPAAVAPMSGGEIPWTAGILLAAAQNEAATTQMMEEEVDRQYHVVITAQGAATHWQARVHYYWYIKVKEQCEAAGKCDMGGFTRLLHSGHPDELMDEIPSFVANPLPDENHKGYVVLNRPYAFVQWLQGAAITEKYVFMSEPDHIWLKPMPNLMVGQRPASFPFFYIEPSKTEFLSITQKFTGPLSRKQAEQIAPVGNAPTLLSLAQLQKMAPMWMNTSMAIFSDEQANKEWGWVLEMYGFAISCFKEDVGPIDLHLKMMSQPPWDKKLDPYYLLHYTYGNDYTLEGEFTPGKIGAWRFDKRSYSEKPPPRNLGAPPDGMKNELVRHLINALNEATNHIPGRHEALGDWASLRDQISGARS
ncbi:hypothetical protein WJX77_011236 [Trebouxia sp. C0004]